MGMRDWRNTAQGHLTVWFGCVRSHATWSKSNKQPMNGKNQRTQCFHLVLVPLFTLNINLIHTQEKAHIVLTPERERRWEGAKEIECIGFYLRKYNLPRIYSSMYYDADTLLIIYLALVVVISLVIFSHFQLATFEIPTILSFFIFLLSLLFFFLSLLCWNWLALPLKLMCSSQSVIWH